MTGGGGTGASGRRWPDLFLVGAALAGTTILRTELLRHPELFMAQPEQPHFFSHVRPSRRFARAMPVVTDEAAYLALFSSARDARVLGEASTSYLWSPDAPGRIAAVAPDARIVILLRDPIERAWAHHRRDAAEGTERRGFLRAVRDELKRPATWGVEPVYLGAGFYADGLERYLRLFGRERVDIRFGESVRTDPRAAARELLAWLGLDPECASDGTDRGAVAAPVGRAATPRRGWLDAFRTRAPVTGAPAQPAMDDTIRRLLERVYAPDVARVSDLLGVIPPWSVTPAL